MTPFDAACIDLQIIIYFLCFCNQGKKRISLKILHNVCIDDDDAMERKNHLLMCTHFSIYYPLNREQEEIFRENKKKCTNIPTTDMKKKKTRAAY